MARIYCHVNAATLCAERGISLYAWLLGDGLNRLLGLGFAAMLAFIVMLLILWRLLLAIRRRTVCNEYGCI